MKKVKLPWVIAILVAIGLVLIGANWHSEVNNARDSFWKKVVTLAKYLSGKLKKSDESEETDDSDE